MRTLTGRYQFRTTWWGGVALWVEIAGGSRFVWRRAHREDLKDGALRPAILDGWRYVEERRGRLHYSGQRSVYP